MVKLPAMKQRVLLAILLGLWTAWVAADGSDAGTADLIGGRSDLRVCVAIDGGTTSINDATRLVRDAITSLNGDPGWYQITQRPSVIAGCPARAAVLARSGTAPQASAGRPEISIVQSPGPFFVHVYVTSAAQVRRVFETLADQVVPEEVTCAANVCEEVTKSLLVDDRTLTDAAALREQLRHALGLVPPTRGVRVTR